MRRRTLLAPAVVLVRGAAGGLWLSHTAPQARYHRSAVADAGQKVDRVLQRFDHDHLYKAEDYAHTAAQQPDVTVLSVTGETHWQTGVTLVLGVVGDGRAYDRQGKLVAEGDERICFRLRLGPHDDSRDDDIACPDRDPLPVRPDPTLDGVDERSSRGGVQAPVRQGAGRPVLLKQALVQRVRDGDRPRSRSPLHAYPCPTGAGRP